MKFLVVIYKHDFRCVTSGSNSRRVSWPHTRQSYFHTHTNKNKYIYPLTIIQYHAEIICLYLGWAIVCLPACLLFACLFVLQKSEANEKEYEKYKLDV
uniref:Uncharacterized protein n=1 Tax=Glossina palpalis gambiensis TaxID=67801 RepID=A0A1B0B726_9MUSC